MPLDVYPEFRRRGANFMPGAAAGRYELRAVFLEIHTDDGVCLHCGSDSYSISANKLPMPYRCRECRRYFSVKTGSVMQGSNLGYQKWAYAIYLMGTNVKDISSIKLHRDLGITQKTAWHLTQRIREGFIGVDESDDDGSPKPGTLEVDEAYFGGKQANKHYDKKIANAQGGKGKTIVMATKERESNKIAAQVVAGRTREELQGFVRENIDHCLHRRFSRIQRHP